jgi:hypothetical protein
MVSFLLKDTRALNVFAFRFFYCGIMAWKLPERALYLRNHYYSFEVGNPMLLPSTGSAQLDYILFYASAALLSLTLLSTAFGFRARLMGILSLVIYTIIAVPLERALSPYDSNVIFFNLVGIAAFPLLTTENLFKKQTLDWPLTFIKLNLGLIYFSAFYSKAINGGPWFMWADGHSLQGYLLERYLMTDNLIAMYIASHLWLCKILSIATVFAEATFWTVIFPSRVGWAVPLVGLSMHIAIYYMMSINFVYFAATYLVFVPYAKIFDYLQSALRRWRWQPILP